MQEHPCQIFITYHILPALNVFIIHNSISFNGQAKDHSCIYMKDPYRRESGSLARLGGGRSQCPGVSLGEAGSLGASATASPVASGLPGPPGPRPQDILQSTSFLPLLESELSVLGKKRGPQHCQLCGEWAFSPLCSIHCDYMKTLENTHQQFYFPSLLTLTFFIPPSPSNSA